MTQAHYWFKLETTNMTELLRPSVDVEPIEGFEMLTLTWLRWAGTRSSNESPMIALSDVLLDSNLNLEISLEGKKGMKHEKSMREIWDIGLIPRHWILERNSLTPVCVSVLPDLRHALVHEVVLVHGAALMSRVTQEVFLIRGKRRASRVTLEQEAKLTIWEKIQASCWISVCVCEFLSILPFTGSSRIIGTLCTNTTIHMYINIFIGVCVWAESKL